MSEQISSKDAIVVKRTFDAPIALVWKMWTESEHFKNWYGPSGFTVSIEKMDFRLGGKRHICMVSPDGKMKMWLAGEYTEIVPTTRLVYTESMADENGAISKEYPMISQIIVELEAQGETTKMLMTHAGIGVNEEGASEGWEEALDKMAAQIARVLKAK